MNIHVRPLTLKRTALCGAALVVSGIALIPSAWASDAAAQSLGAEQSSAITARVAQPPTCFGRLPTPLPPGPGDDVIIGTNGPDTIHGLRGDDWICGRGGNDLLFGDQGNDRLYGEAGNDRLFGGPGNDTLNGGPGFDRCDGGPGIDTAVTVGPNRCEVVVNVP